MPDLTAGSNAALRAAGRFEIAVSCERQHADLICVLLDSDDRADGDDGVALFGQPVCAGGAVRLDPKGDRVSVDVMTLPGAIARVPVVANAVPSSVQMLAFTVNSFGGQQFSDVAKAFCRLIDGGGAERVRYESGSRRDGSLFRSHKDVCSRRCNGKAARGR